MDIFLAIPKNFERINDYLQLGNSENISNYEYKHRLLTDLNNLGQVLAVNFQELKNANISIESIQLSNKFTPIETFNEFEIIYGTFTLDCNFVMSYLSDINLNSKRVLKSSVELLEQSYLMFKNNV